MGGLRWLKRRLQALPASLPTPRFFFSSFFFFFFAFSLLARLFRSSALIESLVQTGSLINLRHLPFAAVLLRLKYPKSLTAFHVYHHQFSCCISHSNLNSQRVFLLCDKHWLDVLAE